MTTNRTLFVAVILSLCLCACGSTKNKKLETRGEFVSRNNDDITEFAYSMTWFMPKNGGRNAILAALGISPRSRGVSFQPDKADRLALEDQAALELEAELRQRNLCPDGYRIDQTLWRDRSVRLIGVCR